MNAPSISIRAELTPNPTAYSSAALQRLILFNVKFSPNLGDGLLSECLERELARSLPGCDIISVDLAGRRTYPDSHGSARGAALALLERCPHRVRQVVAGLMLKTLLVVRLQRRYRTALTDADAVIVGGGNLFSDADLNFPIKISGALAAAARMSLPVAVYGVGVAPSWSKAGTTLFARALSCSRLAWTSVRDHQSQTNWDRHFADAAISSPGIVVDPGVLASLHYPSGKKALGGRKVGFCITHPRAVRYHSDPSCAARLEDWYPAALRSLVEQGFEVELFTNGSPEDRQYLQAHFQDWIRRAKGPVTLGRSFETPLDLAAFVSGCDVVIAHRMHACIAAYSFGVPAIGLRWDVKLDSFFQLAGRAAHILDPATVEAKDLGERICAVMAAPFDPAPLITRARTEIAAFAGLLQRACEKGRS